MKLKLNFFVLYVDVDCLNLTVNTFHHVISFSKSVPTFSIFISFLILTLGYHLMTSSLSNSVFPAGIDLGIMSVIRFCTQIDLLHHITIPGTACISSNQTGSLASVSQKILENYQTCFENGQEH